MTIKRLLTHISRFISWRAPVLLPSIDDGWPIVIEGDYYKAVDGSYGDVTLHIPATIGGMMLVGGVQ